MTPLCLAIIAVFSVPQSRACHAADAILATGEDPALLAAIAYGESRFDWTLTNARGCWGAMQVCGRRPRRWTEAQSYEAGARRLREARAWCARRGTPTRRCQLAAYAGGPRLVRAGTYTGRVVLRRAAAVRAAMAKGDS